jgi:hypothetical protein
MYDMPYPTTPDELAAALGGTWDNAWCVDQSGGNLAPTMPLGRRTWHLFARKFPDGSLRDVASRERLELLESSRPIVPVFVEEWAGDPESLEVTHFGLITEGVTRLQEVRRVTSSIYRAVPAPGQTLIPLKVTELRAMFRLVP